MDDHNNQPVILDRGRYWRVVWFFAGAFASFIGWDLILRRIPGFRTYVDRTSLGRWRRIARRFRALAIRFGGVLIKLGQFLSIRVDVLPVEVTAELADLQDEVPAEPATAIHALLASEFGRPVQQVFTWFSEGPEAAASLAQVHRAKLQDGREVMVKVQRPGIERLVETDLAAMRVAIGWLKLYGPVARRVDLDRLYAEFSTTTRAELDFVAEGKNTERFAADFAGDPGVCVADVHWDYTTPRVLTLQDVTGIKITDLTAIDAAGIDRGAVAKRLYDTYLKQIFVTNFVHADPHPGNLFIHTAGPELGPDNPGPREFVLVFVDFGMVATIPERLRENLREMLIGLALRDSRRVVKAYVDAGVLLPGADLKRLEELHDELFQRMMGFKMNQLRDVAFEQAEYIAREYRDLLFEMPFQLPDDILFVARSVAILSGLATTLNPEFDPWAATLPFAEELAKEEGFRDWRSGLSEIGKMLMLLLRLPGRFDSFLKEAERGNLGVQMSLAPDATRASRQLQRSVDRLSASVIAASLLVSGVLLRALDGPSSGSTLLLVASALAFVWSLARR